MTEEKFSGKNGLAEMYRNYPPEKYITVLPNLFLAEEPPEHISFGVQVFSVSPDPGDKEVFYVEPPLWNCKSSSGSTWTKRSQQKPKGAVSLADEGYVALAKSALQKFDSALGIKWIPEYCRLIQTDRQTLVGAQAAGMIAGLPGANVESDVYYLDLEIEKELKLLKLREYPPKYGTDPTGKSCDWGKLSKERQDELIDLIATRYVLERKQNAPMLVMSGARLRVIRNFTGLPTQFRPSVLLNKAFAVFSPVYRPQAHTERERIALQRELASRFLPAFGGSSPGEPTEERPALPAADPAPEERQIPERTTQDIPADAVEIVDAEIVPDEDEQEPGSEAETAPESTNGGSAVREDAEPGERPAEAESDAPESWSGESYAWILESRRANLLTKNAKQLRKYINQLIDIHEYDLQSDPNGIGKLIEKEGDRENVEVLVKIALILIEHGLKKDKGSS